VQYNSVRILVVSILMLVSQMMIPAHAQTTPLSGEVSANVGFNNVSTQIINTLPTTGIPLNKDYVQFGFSGGLNVTRQVAVLGEFNYLPLASVGPAYVDAQLYGGAVRYSPINKSAIVPYVIASVGGTRVSGTDGGYSLVKSGSNLGVGGGVSIYLNHNWGIRPEFRYIHHSLTALGNTYGLNTSTGTLAVFYQWGGRPEKK
jgi:opacity protein-like surface antigen